MATFELGDASPPNVKEPADLQMMSPLFDMSAASPEPAKDTARAYLAQTPYVIGVEL